MICFNTWKKKSKQILRKTIELKNIQKNDFYIKSPIGRFYDNFSFFGSPKRATKFQRSVTTLPLQICVCRSLALHLRLAFAHHSPIFRFQLPRSKQRTYCLATPHHLSTHNLHIRRNDKHKALIYVSERASPILIAGLNLNFNQKSASKIDLQKRLK